MLVLGGVQPSQIVLSSSSSSLSPLSLGKAKPWNDVGVNASDGAVDDNDDHLANDADCLPPILAVLMLFYRTPGAVTKVFDGGRRLCLWDIGSSTERLCTLQQIRLVRTKHVDRRVYRTFVFLK